MQYTYFTAVLYRTWIHTSPSARLGYFWYNFWIQSNNEIRMRNYEVPSMLTFLVGSDDKQIDTAK